MKVNWLHYSFAASIATTVV